MLAFNDRPSDVDLFEFFLAEKLGLALQAIRGMPHVEYLQWASYYRVKGLLTKMHAEHANKGR